MSHAAFLAAIREHPDADLPRLVYADWLDDAGDHARAEFVRVQCDLAALPDHDPRYRELEDREHELLSEHEGDWLGTLPTCATEWDWKRGFVDEATLRLDCHRQWAQSLNWHPPTRLGLVEGEFITTTPVPDESWIPTELQSVRQLDVTRLISDHGWLWGTDLTDSPALQNLRELLLDEGYPLDRLNELLQSSPHTCRLTRLSVTAARSPWSSSDREWYATEVAGFTESLRHTRLIWLTAHDCGLDSARVGQLLAAPFAATLRHLDVSDNPLGPDAYRAFADARPGMRLDSLDVSGTPLAGISLEPLLRTRVAESLTKLEMNGCGSARMNMEVLARSRFWTRATELRAHSGTIPASTLEPLCGSSGPLGLRLLDLADNYLRTEGVRMVCASPWSEPLTWLALSRNYLDDESCEALARSRLRNLRTLHLAHNNLSQDRSDGEVITDAGVRTLASSPTLANLRLLTLGYTGVTDRAADIALNQGRWRLFGLGLAGNRLTREAVRILAESPRLSRLTWLDLSGNPRLGGMTLMPLAESPYLSRMCDLDCGGIAIAPEVLAVFRERLGCRFGY